VASENAEEEHAVVTEGPWKLELEGYGELQFSWLDFGPNQNREGGSRDDSRLVFEQTRFVLELEGEMPYEIEFGAEIEFEHGGTGAALELEYEEFGEYEQEVEKGGEVVVEELYLAKSFADDAFWVRAGRFYVAMGLLSELYEPTEYLAAGRPESEQTVIPGVWDELGLEVGSQLGPVEITAQVVNGLDSTGFSSQFWVASGHQRRFELVRATDLAGVGRVDVTPLDGVMVGVSAYYGGTSRNRPKPDFAEQCPDGDLQREVAPCGYVSAPLLLVDAHAAIERGPVRARAMALWGKLEKADVISEKNRNLSNNLDVLRTPVAEQAFASWAELGVDIADFTALNPRHRIEPYVRYEYYDTMFDTREDLFDNPRFEKTLYAAGIGYALDEAVTAKLDWTHRSFGSDRLNSENRVRLGLGFVY
jgi:hypothetical protein